MVRSVSDSTASRSPARDRPRDRSRAGFDAAGNDDCLRRQPHLDPRRFGALAFGIGTSEVEHVLATQTLPQSRPKTMAVTVDGELQPGVTAKDVILAIIGKIGTGGGIGHIIEYRGSTIRSSRWKVA